MAVRAPVWVRFGFGVRGTGGRGKWSLYNICTGMCVEGRFREGCVGAKSLGEWELRKVLGVPIGVAQVERCVYLVKGGGVVIPK